jgi:hypothetical protein
MSSALLLGFYSGWIITLGCRSLIELIALTLLLHQASVIIKYDS